MTGSNEKTSCEASVHMHITCSVYKSFDTDEACRTRTAFNLKSELETANNSFKTDIDRKPVAFQEETMKELRTDPS